MRWICVWPLFVFEYSSVYHFAGDTNMLQSDISRNNLSKLMNVDLKKISQWLNANITISPLVSQKQFFIQVQERLITAINLS